MEEEHIPVMVEEVVRGLKCSPGGYYVDATLGAGGHTEEILKLIGDQGRLLAIDRDPQTLARTRERLLPHHQNILFSNQDFRKIDEIVIQRGWEQVDGILFDLGLSSMQIDTPERGFSYRYDAPLDMRMDTEEDITAARLVNELPGSELSEIISRYGEERWASRIVDFIIRHREKKRIKSSFDLVKIIKEAIPASARRRGPHPARRTFQALRIAVNDELASLKEALPAAAGILKPGGRLVAISFHSLEDRIVKHTFRQLASECICPPDLPICSCDKEKQVKVITGSPLLPTDEEKQRNPRARSAKLRIAEGI